MMGSTVTPLKRQRSVKFHIDEKGAKPSIKITVSSDTLAESLLKNNVSSTSTTVEDSEEDSCGIGGAGQQQPALIQIVGNCCSASRGGEGANNPPPNGVLCSCVKGDDKRTRIALDDFTVLEFPNCIDFGIKDFLCCKDEIELDLSSDTDASYLDATPPHRFSDSELDNQIEAMSITLDTQLNPFPTKSFLLKSNIDAEDDDDDEETTEESFIMDEEEASSSASNSATTLCGTGDGAMITDLEQDDHLSVSSERLTEADLQSGLGSSDSFAPQSIGDTDNVNEDQSLIMVLPNEGDKELNSHAVKRQVPEDGGVENDENNTRVHRTKAYCQPEELHAQISREEKMETMYEVENDRKQATVTNGNSGAMVQKELVAKSHSVSRKILQHPSKHFKRQISLPASIFMSYIMEQNNKANYGKQSCCDAKMNLQNEEHHSQKQHNCDIIVKNKLNRSNSCSKKSTNPCSSIMRSSLSKIDSYRSTKVIHGSTEDYEYDDINISDTCNQTKNEFPREMEITDANLTTENVDRGSSPMLLDCARERTDWLWESKSDSFTDDTSNDLENDDEQQAFTSEVEKRSLILRHVRRLIRQDTTGNFAPPDFSI